MKLLNKADKGFVGWKAKWAPGGFLLAVSRYNEVRDIRCHAQDRFKKTTLIGSEDESGFWAHNCPQRLPGSRSLPVSLRISGFMSTGRAG